MLLSESVTPRRKKRVTMSQEQLQRIKVIDLGWIERARVLRLRRADYPLAI
jgi:hypothetical protein